MNVRTAAVLLCLVLPCAGFLFAKDFWEQPFDRWNQKDVIKMLTDSPWAVNQTVAGVVSGKDVQTRESSRERGESEKYHKFTVRLFSALPIREAYVRMSRIRNNYDGMDPQAKEQFDARFNRPLKIDFSDTVLVALEYKSSDPNVERDLKSFFETAKSELLKQSVHLITKTNGRVELKEYFPPSPDGSGAKFAFPRIVGGNAIVKEDDKEFRFELWVPAGVDQQLFVDFKPAKMVYKGAIAY